MHDIKRNKIQEIVTQCNENTNRLLKELAELEKELIDDRERVVEGMKKDGVLDGVLHFLKEEADKGDRIFLNLYNFWKYGRLPKQKIKIKQILNN